MKIGDLKQHCGNCSIVDYCADAFNDLCLCTRIELKKVEEREYIWMARLIQSTNKRHISNTKMCDRISERVAGEED